MEFEELGQPRYRTSNTPDGFKITIPSRKNWFIILFMGFWLIGWVIGEVFVVGAMAAGLIGSISNGTSDAGTGAFDVLFFVAWLGGWTVGGAFALHIWLWQVRGIEKITVSNESLKIVKKTPLLKTTSEYRLRDVVDLRLSKTVPPMWFMSGGMDYWGTGGQLSFDYGAKTVRFGIGLDEAEAKQILKEIQLVSPDIVERTS